MIRQWQTKDAIKIRSLIKAFLTSQDFLGGEVPPTENNVNYLLFVGYDQIAKNNDPHLVYEDAGELIAYIQMGQVFNGLERKQKTCELFGIFVKPEYEHRFISVELIREAANYMLVNGYKKCFSNVVLSNTKMLRNMFYNPAIWPTKVLLEWDITADPQFTEQGIQVLERKKS